MGAWSKERGTGWFHSGVRSRLGWVRGGKSVEPGGSTAECGLGLGGCVVERAWNRVVLHFALETYVCIVLHFALVGPAGFGKSKRT